MDMLSDVSGVVVNKSNKFERKNDIRVPGARPSVDKQTNSLVGAMDMVPEMRGVVVNKLNKFELKEDLRAPVTMPPVDKQTNSLVVG